MIFLIVAEEFGLWLRILYWLDGCFPGDSEVFDNILVEFSESGIKFSYLVYE